MEQLAKKNAEPEPKPELKPGLLPVNHSKLLKKRADKAKKKQLLDESAGHHNTDPEIDDEGNPLAQRVFTSHG